MNILPKEIWEIILEFIEVNEDKCRLLMTCIDMLKCKFYFYESVRMNDKEIQNSMWFDRFTKIICNSVNVKIPLSVTHLFFSDLFNESVGNFIPSTVTHIVFGDLFNQPINGCIPTSVTHLTFKSYFQQFINDSIPYSVTHLIFGHRFNLPIKNNIPSSVTHLTFGKNFGQSLYDIPSSVSHLKISNYSMINNEIPPFIKEVIIYSDHYGIAPEWRKYILKCNKKNDTKIIFSE